MAKNTKKTLPKKNNPGKANVDSQLPAVRAATVDASGQQMTTNAGLPVNDDQNSLKAGARGPSLLEDFILREKITHFDHERIPERAVHARGSGAHGFFQPYQSMKKYTKAAFLQSSSIKTPVFVRFSTVAGSRGSTDLARDVRGFAVRFYTQEGNYDLVGNNIPVFFIQDALKFPDLVHAVKPEPHNEMPQAASAHDTFWDFISLMPESAHMILWVMSDRGLPRSYRMMEGFGVHTFRFVNAEGKTFFVKFHWKPLLGVHSVAWDEAQKISGKDPDFHRRDLWEAIEAGNFPEYELGVQIIDEKDEHKFDFDLLDPTKLVPEELVPVTKVGKLTLNRNPDNFFAETEQVAFQPGNIVSGIDFTNDPLLQGRLFSYTDTQLIRLGGPNFHEIPINRPVVPVHNNQRDGFMRQMVNKGRVSYQPNSLDGNSPQQVSSKENGFISFMEKIAAIKERSRGKKFFDHFSQAQLFLRSQTEPEKNHIINALTFELQKVETVAIRERMVSILTQIDLGLAKTVAEGVGVKIPTVKMSVENFGVPADGDPKDFASIIRKPTTEKSVALSMQLSKVKTIKTRKIACLLADGFNGDDVSTMMKKLEAEGAEAKLIAPKISEVSPTKGQSVKPDFSFLTASSVFFDAVYVPGGSESIKTLKANSDAIHFVNEAFKHCKALAFTGDAVELLDKTNLPSTSSSKKKKGAEAALPGVIISSSAEAAAKAFIAAIAEHRHWERELNDSVPA